MNIQWIVILVRCHHLHVVWKVYPPSLVYLPQRLRLVSVERQQFIWTPPLAFNLFHSTVDFIGSIFIPRSGWFLPLHVCWAAVKRNCSGIFLCLILRVFKRQKSNNTKCDTFSLPPDLVVINASAWFSGSFGTTPKKYFIFYSLCVHSHPQLWASYSKYMRTFQCFIDPLFSSQITYGATPTKLKTNLHFIYLTYPSRRCDTRNSGISLHTNHVWFTCDTVRVYFITDFRHFWKGELKDCFSWWNFAERWLKEVFQEKPTIVNGSFSNFFKMQTEVSGKPDFS